MSVWVPPRSVSAHRREGRSARSSDRAWAKIESFETASLYADLEPWRDAADEWFPYTHLAANLYGLETAIDLLLEEGTRDRLRAPRSGCAAVSRANRRSRAVALSAPAVVADRDRTPGLADAQSAQTLAARHDIVLATGLGDLADDILRIGHMGHNAPLRRIDRTMDALEAVLE